MVRDLFVQRPSSRMHGIVIWLPMLEGDSPEEASRQARSWRDERVDQWWDADKRVSQRFQRALGLHGPAWDLYLLYRRGVRWDGDLPPSPTFWMHQIPDDAGADPDLCLDPARLSGRLDMLLQELPMHLTSTITCPSCGAQTTETMELNSCRYLYSCPSCRELLRPLHGDCCVFCSYGDVPCPPKQTGNACCG